MRAPIAKNLVRRSAGLPTEISTLKLNTVRYNFLSSGTHDENIYFGSSQEKKEVVNTEHWSVKALLGSVSYCDCDKIFITNIDDRKSYVEWVSLICF